MRKKILLVDDAETILMMERMMLSKGDYEFITAKDGLEAVEKALAEKPDLILLDIIMPKMSGVDACKELRSHDITKSIPIIIVSTRGEARNMESSFENGCTDYITKPINGVELVSKVRNYLGEKN